jgi:hypothetical protein
VNEQSDEPGHGGAFPLYCTGWRGIHAFAREMPGAFVHPSVGNLYRFEASV